MWKDIDERKREKFTAEAAKVGRKQHVNHSRAEPDLDTKSPIAYSDRT
jgi:hypothetical protein